MLQTLNEILQLEKEDQPYVAEFKRQANEAYAAGDTEKLRKALKALGLLGVKVSINKNAEVTPGDDRLLLTMVQDQGLPRAKQRVALDSLATPTSDDERTEILFSTLEAILDSPRQSPALEEEKEKVLRRIYKEIPEVLGSMNDREERQLLVKRVTNRLKLKVS